MVWQVLLTPRMLANSTLIVLITSVIETCRLENSVSRTVTVKKASVPLSPRGCLLLRGQLAMMMKLWLLVVRVRLC